MLGLAFIIPAYKIFDDIKSRFGEEPLLCPSPSVIQPYSAPNDGKVAERPLLDLIKGKGTGAMIQLRGSPAVGKTVPPEVVASHARRHFTSIRWGCPICPRDRSIGTCDGWKRHMKEHESLYPCNVCAASGKIRSYSRKINLLRHLKTHSFSNDVSSTLADTWNKTFEKKYFGCGFCVFLCTSLTEQLTHIDSEHFRNFCSISDYLVVEVTKFEEIAEIMLKAKAANGTLLDRIGDFLQPVVQEVSDGRMAFFQGDPSGRFFFIDACDELMPATFGAIAFSARPPSFASIVPSIRAYNHIDGNHGTTSEAAEAESYDVYNRILVWKIFPKKCILS